MRALEGRCGLYGVSRAVRRAGRGRASCAARPLRQRGMRDVARAACAARVLAPVLARGSICDVFDGVAVVGAPSGVLRGPELRVARAAAESASGAEASVLSGAVVGDCVARFYVAVVAWGHLLSMQLFARPQMRRVGHEAGRRARGVHWPRRVLRAWD